MLFRKNIDPRCAYCAKGSRINDEQVVCVKRGVVPASGGRFQAVTTYISIK